MIGCVLALAACSGDEGSKNSSNTDTPDTGVDATPSPDMGSAGNNATEEDMAAPDDMTSPPEDMSPADVSEPDMTTEPDVADMAMVPDLPPQMCFHPSTDPACPMGQYGPGTFLNAIEVDESGKVSERKRPGRRSSKKKRSTKKKKA